MTNTQEEIAKIENCRYHRDGLKHICKEEDDPAMPKVLAEFGIVSKAIQSTPKEADMDKPYWASSHEYDPTINDWGTCEIELNEFKQSGYTHHFGVISLGIADAICRVPSLAASTDTLEICRRTIHDDVTAQYQRPLEFERIDILETFLSTEPTIVNPVILEISKEAMENGSAIITGDKNTKKLNIDMSRIEFINKHFRDVDLDKGIDYRPIDLVDGQHRVRSSRLGTKANNIQIPFVLVDPDYEGGGGRLFAEINVQINGLPKLHKLHLRYVLGLASHEAKDDFGFVPQDFLDEEAEYTEDEVQIFRRRFANRMAYRVGARLTANKNGPMYDRIAFYEGAGKSDTKKAIDAYEWISHCNPWVLQFDELACNEDNFVRVVQCYFKAWKITANLDPNTGISYHDSEENDRWDEGQGYSETSRVHSRLFYKIAFKSIMALFPLTYELSGVSIDSNDGDLVKAFVEVLKPCQPIDGLDLKAWDVIMGASSRSAEKEEHIYQWMSWAIYDYHKYGKLAPPEKAWNIEDGETIDVPSAPGQGFFSPVNPEFFTGTLKVKNVSYDDEEALNGATITITADEIPNESVAKTISFMYVDGNGKKRPERKTKHTKGPRNGIGYNYMKQLFQTSTKLNRFSSLEITVTSSNLFSAGAVEIFRQSYTLQELRDLNNCSIYLTTQEPSYSSDDSDLEIEEFPTASIGANHYVIDSGQDTTELDDDETEPLDIPDEVIFKGPPPRNTRSHSQKSIDMRRLYRPAVNPCQRCFHGLHDSANCGFNKW